MTTNKDIQKCTGVTQDGYVCIMKRSCKRYESYSLDDEVYISVSPAPACIAFTPLECPLKLEITNE